jgi:hypothetical protein
LPIWILDIYSFTTNLGRFWRWSIIWNHWNCLVLISLKKANSRLKSGFHGLGYKYQIYTANSFSSSIFTRKFCYIYQTKRRATWHFDFRDSRWLIRDIKAWWWAQMF